MPNQQDRLELIIEARNRAEAALKSLARDIEGVGRSVLRFSGIGGAVGAIGGAVGFGAVAKGVLDATMAMEGYQARLMTLLGTQERVNAAIAQLNKLDAETPFNINELIDGFTRLAAYGLNPTMERMRTVGDFASSMQRSFTDAVEAIADAQRGEFERMKEFGLSKEQVAAFGKNLINAQGQVKDYGRWQEALFAAMAARSAGSMERMSQTIQGKWSTLQGAMFRAFVGLGEGLRVPIGNALTVITRMIESLAEPSRLKRISDWLSRAFSVENMRTFAVAAVRVFASIEAAIARAVARIQNLGLLIKAYSYELKGDWEEWKALFTGGSHTSMGRSFLAVGESYDKAAASYRKRYDQALAAPDQRAGQIVANAERWMSGLFKGLSNTPSPALTKPGPGANFGAPAGGNTAKNALDRITDIILGGGELGRLGVRATELGRGIKPGDKTIKVDASGIDRYLKVFVERIAEQTLTQAIKKGIVAPVGR